MVTVCLSTFSHPFFYRLYNYGNFMQFRNRPNSREYHKRVSFSAISHSSQSTSKTACHDLSFLMALTSVGDCCSSLLVIRQAGISTVFTWYGPRVYLSLDKLAYLQCLPDIALSLLVIRQAGISTVFTWYSPRVYLSLDKLAYLQCLPDIALSLLVIRQAGISTVFTWYSPRVY